jgi:hypothetical protein
MAAMASSGCGKKSKKSHNGNSAVAPTSSEAALNLLSPEYKEKFDKWSKALTKSCDADEIMSGKAGDGRGIDTLVLLGQTGKSLLFPMENGAWAMLQNYSGPSGESRVHRISEVSGTGIATSKVDFKTERSGTACKVYVFEKLVYETEIATQIKVAAGTLGNPLNEGNAKPRLSVTKFTEKNGISFLSQHGFINALETGLRPEQKTLALLGSKLGLTEAEAKQIFVAGDFSSVSSLISVASDGSIPAFSGSFSDLIGSSESIKKLVQPGASTVLNLRMRPAVWTVANARINLTDENKLWALQATVKVDATADSADRLNYTATATTLEAAVDLSNALAKDCFLQRLDMHAKSEVTPTRFAPSYSSGHGNCALLSKDGLEKSLYDDAAARAVVLNRFVGVVPSSTTHYQGWDSILLNFVSFVTAAEGEDAIVRTLDPEGTRPVLQSIEQNLLALKSAVQQHANLNSVGDDLRNLAIQWALSGHKAEAIPFARITAAAANVIDVVPESTRRMLNGLLSNPSGDVEILDYALNLGAEVKTKIQTVSTLASELEQSSWISDQLGNLLQKKVTTPVIDGWKTTLEAGKAFYDRDVVKIKDNNPTASAFELDSKLSAFKSIISQIVKKALDEQWTPESFATLEKLALLGQKSNMCDRFFTAAQIADCVGLLEFSTKEKMLLNPAFQGRYGIAAEKFATLHDLAKDSALFGFKSDLQDLFNPLWSSCNNELFTAKLTQFEELAKRYVGADFQGRFALDRQIQETREDCR